MMCSNSFRSSFAQGQSSIDLFSEAISCHGYDPAPGRDRSARPPSLEHDRIRLHRLRRRNFVAWPGEGRRPCRGHGRGVRRRHATKDPGPSGSVAADVWFVASLDRAQDPNKTCTLFEPLLPSDTPRHERSRCNLIGSCPRHPKPRRRSHDRSRQEAPGSPAPIVRLLVRRDT